MFTSINKEEHELGDTFLNDEKVRVKNEMVPNGGLLLAVADDSDEEMQSVASDEDEEPRVGGPVTMMTTAKTVSK
jgi:structure-specific recognition protein 1